jgi:hypothetical protein
MAKQDELQLAASTLVTGALIHHIGRHEDTRWDDVVKKDMERNIAEKTEIPPPDSIQHANSESPQIFAYCCHPELSTTDNDQLQSV